MLGAKARAILAGKYHVDFADIQAVAAPVLRHRLVLNFHARADNLDADVLVERLLEIRARGGRAMSSRLILLLVARVLFRGRTAGEALRPRPMAEGYVEIAESLTMRHGEKQLTMLDQPLLFYTNPVRHDGSAWRDFSVDGGVDRR